jgi:2-octaprenyl-6-methoxyphenol hydroxylase
MADAPAGEITDLLIIGGGPVGLACALAASRHGLSARVLEARGSAPASAGGVLPPWQMVPGAAASADESKTEPPAPGSLGAGDPRTRPPASADPRTLPPGSADPRALALAEGTRQFLSRLGAWPAAQATMIREVCVSHAGSAASVRLTAHELGLPQLGAVLRYDDLCAALADAASAAGERIQRAEGAAATDFSVATDHCTASAGGRRYAGRLLVHAEGAASDESLFADYAQDALLATVTPVRPHGNRAHERFAPQGPLALLPCGDAYAAVLIVPRGTAGDLDADDRAFLDELARRLAGEIALAGCGPRRRLPLALRARPGVDDGKRQLWVGNAAQSLHPISAQGLNLGLRDAACLGEALAEAEPTDAGRVLARYRARRQFDRLPAIAFTDLLARLAAEGGPGGRALGAAIGALALLPPLRRAFAGQLIFGHRVGA